MGRNVKLIKNVVDNQLKLDIPDFKAGDTVRVHVKIKEATKERIQQYEGVVIKVSGRGINKTFTVRKESFGVGVERTFLMNSPSIAKLQLIKKGKVSKSRIYYMRERSGKAARIESAEK